MELPTTHRVPVSWLHTNACSAIRYRLARDILTESQTSPEELSALHDEASADKRQAQIAKKQKTDGTWSGKMLTPAGTIEQFRHLVELGLTEDHRTLQVGSRPLFRILSRDPDPALHFEFKKEANKDPDYADWVREMLREAATAALVEAKLNRDPRVRGAAKRIIDEVADFLRSDYVDDPYIKVGSKTVLRPGLTPPTRYSIAMMAHMPTLQRERAGFVEKLGAFITQPADKKSFWIQAGGQTFKSNDVLMGEALAVDASGRPKDLPLALHWLELLARLDCLHLSENAQKVLRRLTGECNDEGVWSPKSLKAAPASASDFTNHMFPLEYDTKTAQRRRTDVTFRIALICRLAGMELDFT